MQRGFIFAASGPGYLSLAQQAAATVAQHHKDIPIDLFADQDCDDPVFSQIHTLTTPTLRPRFEAILRSRFERAIVLDGDLFVIAPIADIFDSLDHFDIALAHDQRLNVGSHTLVPYTKPIPAVFPQYNGGVLGIRKSDRTNAFIQKWQNAFETSGMKIGQPALRELLFESDLRICTLPQQYNVIDVDLIRSLDSRTMAPRVIHSSRLHLTRTETGEKITTLTELVGPDFEHHLQEWLLRDETLNPERPKTRAEAFCDKFPGESVHPDARRFGGKGNPVRTTLGKIKRIVFPKR